MPTPTFRDRREAGRRLAREVVPLALDAPYVLALPRGGVPVGFEVARAIGAPLDVIVALKVGAPDHPELAVGAVAEGDVRVEDADSLQALAIGPAEFSALVAGRSSELDRRISLYRAGRLVPSLAGRDVVIVDDGLATGCTAEAALAAVRRLSPARVVLAVPVCAAETAHRLSMLADQVVCVVAPDDLVAVGAWYDDFDQTSDDEVIELLDRARTGRSRA